MKYVEVLHMELYASVCVTNTTTLLINVLSNLNTFTFTGPTLKVVSTMSVGYDHIELDQCKTR